MHSSSLKPNLLRQSSNSNLRERHFLSASGIIDFFVLRTASFFSSEALDYLPFIFVLINLIDMRLLHLKITIFKPNFISKVNTNIIIVRLLYFLISLILLHFLSLFQVYQ